MLNKGLTFSPTNSIDPFDLKVDDYKFFRHLHLKHFFSTRSSVLSSHAVSREATPYKKKSLFLPSSNLSPTTLTYSKLVEKDLAEICQTSHAEKWNMNESELKALNNLESRIAIIIRPGGSVVVMAFEQYNSRIRSQPSEAECYTPLKSNPTDEFKNQIDEYIESAFTRGCITEKEKNFLLVECPKCPVFCGLPKVLKSTTNPPLLPYCGKYWQFH